MKPKCHRCGTPNGLELYDSTQNPAKIRIKTYYCLKCARTSLPALFVPREPRKPAEALKQFATKYAPKTRVGV